MADAQKQMDSVLRRLQKTVDGKPLTIPMSLDVSKFTTFEAALRGSIQHITDDAKNLKAALDSSLQTDNSANINRITEAMRNLEAAWKALPNNQKFDINDRLTPKAQEMIRQFNELATASSTYGQTLSQIAGKIERVADEEARANQKRNDGYAKLRKTLGAQENSIANLSAKIKAYQQILNSKEIGSRSFERVAAKIRKLTEQLDKAKEKVRELTVQTQSGAAKQAAAHRQVSGELKNQSSYLQRLTQRMVAYWSVQQVGQFLTAVREVTAEFELQRVSLGAILQDQNDANRLFSQIKSFALKSPVKILDLTKYTKQLAAYKIGWNGVKTDTKELFETMKRLTDVSVGLSVPMERIILMFGQIRATGYLRASEVRQATEAGIPLVEELAKKLEKLNGETVTAADVMDMISKRAISFDLVKEVFEDMTSAGGIFYNMQEKQGNTLYGMWQKLGDAVAIMYEEIGKTGPVNEAMKTSISVMRTAMLNWERAAVILGILAAVALKWRLASIASANAVRMQTPEHIRYVAALRAEMVSQNAATSSASKWNIVARTNAWATRQATIAKYQAATANGVLTRSFNTLKAAMLSNPWTLIIGLIASAVAALWPMEDEIERISDKLADIDMRYANTVSQSTKRFEELAAAATQNADGSRKQKEALDELQRSYRDILPAEALELENLRALHGTYGALTDQIQAYYAMKKKEEKEDAIRSNYAEVFKGIKEKMREQMENFDIPEEKIADALSKFDSAILDGRKDLDKVIADVYRDLEIDNSNLAKNWGRSLFNSVKNIFTKGDI